MTMNNNTESTSNSIKFAPMPMSALLANLMPLQTQSDTPDSSFTTDESDDSFSESVANKKKSQLTIKSTTPQYKVSKENKFKSFASERKICKNDDNKENYDINKSNNEIFSNKGVNVLQSDLKLMKTPSYSNSEIKIVNVLKAPDNNVKIYNKCNSAHKKTPELPKVPSSCHKTRTGTPKIKSGIRKFTPGSARQSQKKTPHQTVIQNRDKVRCELFGHNKKKDDSPQAKPAPVVIVSENIQKKNEPPLAKPVPVVMVPVPETPINKKPMPASYAATPSYPQGVVGNNSKILFKTTCIKDKKYMFIKKLGTGGSSEVYKVLEVGTSSEYAVKCVYLATDQDLAQGYINEVRLLRELQNSDRVIRLYDYEYDRQNQFLRMVLEVGETDLSSFLRARGAGLPPALVVHYWEEMLHAVNYIHEHGVIHADLKPANFLLVSGRLKLIDFGIASAISGDATSVVRAQAAGTYSYISPEALMGGAGGYGGSENIKISFRSDVWSLGCILYSMVYGRTPFGHIPNLAKLAAILDPNHRIDYPPTDHLPQTLISTLKWCLTYNARSRPSVRELLSVRHLQPARASLPADLLERLRPLVSPHDYKLLQQAQI